LLGLPLDRVEQFQQNIEKVTPEQIQAVAQRYFQEKSLTVATLQPESAR
jgi:zinc protease